METLIKHISGMVVLSAAAKKDLRQCLIVQHFPKKEKVIEKGKKSTKLYFVLKGAVRSFQYRKEKEITTWIYHSHKYFAAWDSFFYQSKNDEIFEVVDGATLVSIEYEELQQLFKMHPALEKWGRKLMEEYMVCFNQFNQQMRFATAQEKYEFYLRQFPPQPKIKLGYIASFLGITQETLSRLRKKAKSKN